MKFYVNGTAGHNSYLQQSNNDHFICNSSDNKKLIIRQAGLYNIFIIKFPYNAHSDQLKQRALSENKARVDDGELAFEFVIRNFDKFDPN